MVTGHGEPIPAGQRREPPISGSFEGSPFKSSIRVSSTFVLLPPFLSLCLPLFLSLYLSGISSTFFGEYEVAGI